MLETRDLLYVIDAHSNHPRKPSKAFRKGDVTVPYHTHPIWCATTILSDITLPSELRYEGAVALLYHDLLEDTTMPLPCWLSDRVASFVVDMTFADSSEEMQLGWEKSPEVRLLKLYDKVHNNLDGSWMTPEKRVRYVAYTLQLADDVRSNFGELVITRMARSICS